MIFNSQILNNETIQKEIQKERAESFIRTLKYLLKIIGSENNE